MAEEIKRVQVTPNKYLDEKLKEDEKNGLPKATRLRQIAINFYKEEEKKKESKTQ